ncbi:hypothetical protein AAG906_015628 [Vitis piasezkii]
MESKNPYAHIKEFEEVCNTFHEGGASIDLMRLKLFPFNLKDKKFFPTHRTNGLKRQISNFSAKENEKFYDYFYDGMSSLMKQLLETMCGGDFMSKNPEEAMDFLSYVAKVSRGWDEPNAREVGRMKSQPNAPNAKTGMYTLNEDIDMKAKVAAMARRLEELEMKKIQKVSTISETPVQAMSCSICQSFEHLVEECPTIPTVREMAPQYTQPGQAPPQASNLKQAIVNLSRSWKTLLETKNPSMLSSVREVKVVITLRSGKEVDLPTSKPEHEPESKAEKEKREEIKGKRKGNSAKNEDLESNVNEEPERTINQEDMMKKHTPPPFPQALHGKKGINNASEILEKAFLTEQVSAIIQCKSLVKYKDPGCPTILVMIGGTCVEKALLDLGASVNLLPYSIYKQLGLGELKPTSMTLSLADRSVKIPRGMIEDVLVQVDKFYYLVDFVVLDTNPLNIFYLCKKQFHPEEEEGPKREEILSLFNGEETQEVVKKEPPKLILKPLPTKLEYAYLEENKQSPVVISLSLTTPQKDCLLEVLRRCKKAIRWQISDLKGISSLGYTHHIYMEEEVKFVNLEKVEPSHARGGTS